MTPKGLPEYCRQQAFKRYVYFTGNQHTPPPDLDIKLFFDEVVYLQQPDSIALKSGKNLLLIKSITDILIDNSLDSCAIVTLVTNNSTRLTILADR